MKKIFLLFLLLFVASVGGLHADDTLRRAQQALRDQGFYYGPIDGTNGDETTQALRRYQIRNGLAVTGQLNQETLHALQINGAAVASSGTGPSKPRPPADPAAPPPVISSRPEPSTTPRPAPPPPPDDERPDAPTGPAPNNLPPNAQPPSRELTLFFAGTPYEFAPPALQSDVLRRAQIALGREGFYQGAADGALGPLTVEAITEFQGAIRLPRTSRLDTPTLGSLRLMPVRRHGYADDDTDEPRYYPAPPRQGPPVIYEGRIAR